MEHLREPSQSRELMRETLKIVHDTSKEFQFDWEEAITDVLPLQSLGLKRNKIC